MRIVYNMVHNSRKRAAKKEFGKDLKDLSVQELSALEYISQDQAKAIWLPLIAVNKSCYECGIPVVEFQNHGIDQASPQRPDPTKDYHQQPDGVKVSCLGCQR